MEEQKEINQDDQISNYQKKNPISSLPFPAIFVLGVMTGALVVYGYYNLSLAYLKSGNPSSAILDQANNDLPMFSESVELPVRWDNMGKQMVDSGVINAVELEKIYASRGGLDQNAKKLLYSSDNGNLVINQQNSGYLLNLLWALGLGNKNPILENGPIQNKQYGGAANFASTGGWTLAKGKTMDHYSTHHFFDLTSQQQAVVETVSKGIYRPCCGNSTYFPDCNHGMAMLGLLELAASQGKSEAEIYKIALVVNSYWFPDNYKTIAKFMAANGVEWKDVDAKQILGANMSSNTGYNNISSQIQPIRGNNQGSCGV